MGFFHTEAGTQARKKTHAAPKRAAPGKFTESQRALFTCQQCPLDHAKLQTPKMAPAGSTTPLVYFLGDFPTRLDDSDGKHLAGSPGAVLRSAFPEQWQDLSFKAEQKAFRWNNTTRCTPKNTPEALEVACCKRLQVQDIEETKPQVIVGFGQAPLTWMLGADRLISVWRGRRVPVKVGTHTCWYYPIWHPAEMVHMQAEKKKGEAYHTAFRRDLYRIYSDIEAGLPEPYVEPQGEFLKGIETLSVYGSEGLQLIENALGEFHDQDHANDIETNGTRPYIRDAKILTIAVGTYDRTFAFPWHHKEARWSDKERNEIGKMLYDYLMGPGVKWAHGAHFEQEWYHQWFGPDVLYRTKWGNTMSQAHTIDERKPPKSRGISLDSLTQLHFGFRIKDQSSVDVTRMEHEPLRKILPYNGMDTKYTHALAIIQAEILGEQELTPTYARINDATRSLVTMQAKGVVRNLPVIEELNAALEKETAEVVRKIERDADVRAFVEAGNKFNPASNPNLVAFFKDHLKYNGKKDGGFSVDEEALAEFKHPVAKSIIALRSVEKRAGYITPLREGGKYVYPDGLVHAQYNNLITVTGRLACEDPNQQNYPRRQHKEIRRAICAPPGHKFVAFDYGQLEARIVAMIANDPTLQEEIWNGQDIHGDWTDRIGQRFVLPRYEASRKAVRDDIKQYWTFANFYGQTLDGLAWDLAQQWDMDTSRKGMDKFVDELEPFYDDFWKRYAKVKAYQKALLSNYWKNGYVETATGFRRHEPMALNELINQPIQGTAGHLVIDAQIRISDRAYFEERPSLQPIMNIHDDLSFYIPDETLERDVEDIAQTMVSGSDFKFLSVPLSVEVSIGDNWCDKQEIATFTTDRNGKFYEVIK